MGELTLQTSLQPMGPAGAIVLDDDQVAALSTAKVFPVVVTIDGRSARLRLARMGGRNLIGFSKATRAALKVELGDAFEVLIAPDTEERTVEMPSQLAEALSADPAAKTVFDSLSFTRRKEIAASISEAKQAATRERRLAKALAELRG